MAERRMFAKQIVESDAFTDMPLSTQALYFHLGMAADDEGFVNNPKKIQRMLGASDDDLKILIGKRFLLAFESGVVVVKHWKINNFIRSDRFKPTVHKEEKMLIGEKENHAYTDDTSQWLPVGIPNDNQLVYPVQSSQGQSSIGKNRLGKDSISHHQSIAEQLTDDDYEKLSSILPPGVLVQIIDLIDEKGITPSKSPKNYILSVAKEKGYI